MLGQAGRTASANTAASVKNSKRVGGEGFSRLFALARAEG